MKIGFGSDHAGVALKDELRTHLEEQGYECVDFGAFSPEEQDNYPQRALLVAQAVMRGEVDKGVLICGTGAGMALAANKVPGIRAVACSDTYTAEMAVRHNNANILTLGARILGDELAKSIMDVFLRSAFEGGRHAVRVDMIAEIERQYGAGWHD